MFYFPCEQSRMGGGQESDLLVKKGNDEFRLYCVFGFVS